MVDPVWFSARMQGIALVPEPLWWLMGAIVGFYFGARQQAKGQAFQRSIAASLSRAGQVTEGIAALRALEAGSGSEAASGGSAETSPRNAAANVIEADFADNPALAEWKKTGA